MNITFQNILSVVLLSFSILICGNNREKKAIKPAVLEIDTLRFSNQFDSLEAQYKNVLSSDFVYLKSKCFLLVSNLTLQETTNLQKNSVERAYKCFYNDYFEAEPSDVVTIFLFKDDFTYRYWADRLYGDNDDLSPYGYYKQSKKVMLMNIATGSGTLIHEMTHSLVRYDFPDIPSWFNEGLGSLYERCSLENGEIKGHVNWRLPTLINSIKNNNYNSLETLMSTDDETFYGEESGLNYSQARYFCMYLQEQGVLKRYYKNFRDNFSKDEKGISIAEEILNKSINEIDKDYKSWVLTLN